MAERTESAARRTTQRTASTRDRTERLRGRRRPGTARTTQTTAAAWGRAPTDTEDSVGPERSGALFPSRTEAIPVGATGAVHSLWRSCAGSVAARPGSARFGSGPARNTARLRIRFGKPGTVTGSGPDPRLPAPARPPLRVPAPSSSPGYGPAPARPPLRFRFRRYAGKYCSGNPSSSITAPQLQFGAFSMLALARHGIEWLFSAPHDGHTNGSFADSTFAP
jgi:hypothetical protein